MAAISDAVVIGIVLGLVFAAVSYYLYSRMTQLERKVGLMENILLDLKITTEQTLLATEEPPSGNRPSDEELDSYQNVLDEAVEQQDVNQDQEDYTTEEEKHSDEQRELYLEQPRTRATTSSSVQVEKSEKSENSENSDNLEKTGGLSTNYEAMTYRELTALAKQYGISGLRNLSKAHVIDAIRKKDGSSPQQTISNTLSSWANGTVSFSESSEQSNVLELDSFPDKNLEALGTLDAEDVDTTLVQ